jgi:hypothetical protein
MIRSILSFGLLATCLAVQAQSPAPTTSSAAKKDLVAKVMKLQQPGIDNVARQLVEQPAAQMMQQAGLALQQRVAADRRQAVAADIQADVRKYAEEVGPVAREKANKLAPAVLGPILEEKFTEDELKQLIAIIESPTRPCWRCASASTRRPRTAGAAEPPRRAGAGGRRTQEARRARRCSAPSARRRSSTA